MAPKISDASRKLARWHLRPSGLAFDIVQRTGTKGEAVAALWRLPAGGTDKAALDERTLVLNINTDAGRIRR